jgi:hypothetical protein
MRGTETRSNSPDGDVSSLSEWSPLSTLRSRWSERLTALADEEEEEVGRSTADRVLLATDMVIDTYLRDHGVGLVTCQSMMPTDPCTLRERQGLFLCSR